MQRHAKQGSHLAGIVVARSHNDRDTRSYSLSREAAMFERICTCFAKILNQEDHSFRQR